MKTNIQILSVLMCVALVAAPLPASAAAPPSDFFDFQPELKPDPGRPGALRWEKPGFDRSKYNKIKFEPLVVFLAPDSEYKGLHSEQVHALGLGFRDILVQEFEPEIALVEVTGSGVLYVRTALTGVKLKKPKRKLLSYTPVGLLVTAAQDAIGRSASLQDATMEVEAYDGATGEPVAAIIDKLTVEKTKPGKEFSWESLEDNTRFYAKRMKSWALSERAK